MKTHVTVIPSDGIISVDGEVLFLDGITSETFHALQWHDGAGHVEPGDGLPNEELSTDDYAGRVAPFVALWEEEKARLEEEANRPPTDEELAAQAVAEARAQSRSILMARMQADMVQTGAFAAAEFATFAKAGLFTDWAAAPGPCSWAASKTRPCSCLSASMLWRNRTSCSSFRGMA